MEEKEIQTILSEIEEDLIGKFEIFQTLLFLYNQNVNLTTVTEKKEVLYKHFLDSCIGRSLFPKNALVAEVGSGAGFPSIPLKIMREDLKFCLFESVKKKCVFLETAVEALRLSKTEVHCIRAEDAGREERFREKFDVCCARAVARMNTLLEYCLPLVRVGGRVIAYKGQVEEELAQARRAIAVLGGKLESVHTFSLPENFGERALVVIQKISPTPAKYPRGRGKERREPIL